MQAAPAPVLLNQHARRRENYKVLPVSCAGWVLDFDASAPAAPRDNRDGKTEGEQSGA